MRLLPPLLARFKYGSVTLWVPLVLLWPLALVVVVPLLIGVTIFSLFAPGLSLRELGRLCGGLYLILCELHGTVVSVDGPDVRIAFTLY
jgi:hypothetical protein